MQAFTAVGNFGSLRVRLHADYKETMEIGKDYDSVWQNRWPDAELPEFKPWANSFFASCHKLHTEVSYSLLCYESVADRPPADHERSGAGDGSRRALL